MLLLKENYGNAELYEERDEIVCIKAIKHLCRHLHIDMCNYFFNLIKKYPRLIIYNPVIGYYNNAYLNDNCVCLEYLVESELVTTLDGYKEDFYILDDCVVTGANLFTLDLYRIEDYKHYNLISSDLRKHIIGEILNNL